MQTHDLERIRYITQSYEALKGLKMVTFGLFMIVMAAGQLGWTGLGEQGDCTFTLPLFAFLLVLYIAADQYYTRTFGIVHALPHAPSLVFGLIIALTGYQIGKNTGRSASEVGRASRSAVVYASMFIIMANLILNQLLVL